MDIDIETVYTVLKICGVVLSTILLYRFRRDILKIVTDIVVGGDTKEYAGKDLNEIRERLDSRIEEVLK